MDDEAEVSREYERLRAELTAFVLDSMSERMAAGDRPELSAALVEAIDRRVDSAVANRLASADWPDPEAFAQKVIAAARRQGGRSEGAAAGRRSDSRTSAPRPLVPFLLGALTAAGILLVAYFAYQALRGPAEVSTSVQTPISNGVENTSTGPVNIMIEPAGNGFEPPNGQRPAG